MKYKIPRNVKTGLQFFGLELKGWLLFLPTIIFLALPIFVFMPWRIEKFILLGSIVAITHMLFQTDERTGAMNVTLFVERIKWMYSDKKIIEPVWSDEFERTSTIQIAVQKKGTRDTETRDTN